MRLSYTRKRRGFEMPTLLLKLDYTILGGNAIDKIDIPLDFDSPVTLRITRGDFSVGQTMTIVDNTGTMRTIKMRRIVNLRYELVDEGDHATQSTQEVGILCPEQSVSYSLRQLL